MRNEKVFAQFDSTGVLIGSFFVESIHGARVIEDPADVPDMVSDPKWVHPMIPDPSVSVEMVPDSDWKHPKIFDPGWVRPDDEDGNPDMDAVPREILDPRVSRPQIADPEQDIPLIPSPGIEAIQVPDPDHSPRMIENPDTMIPGGAVEIPPQMHQRLVSQPGKWVRNPKTGKLRKSKA